jgi:hypothetical protein
MPSSADVSSFSKFGSSLRRAGTTLRQKMDASLAESADDLAAKVRANVSYSERISNSVKVVPAGDTVTVTAGGSEAPEAAPIENKGKGFVRHPIFVPAAEMPGPPGSWTRKNSKPPFFAPAVAASEAPFEESAKSALEETLSQVAFDNR